MRKTQLLKSKPIYLGLSILDLSKTVMYKLYSDYVKPKYGENAKLCYMNPESFIVHIRTEDTYKDIVENVETRFNSSDFELQKLLPQRKNKKVIGLIKDELAGEIMKEFVGLREKNIAI